MKIVVLGSSSSGNSTYVECGETKFLIDAGFSYTYIKDSLFKLGVTPDQIRSEVGSYGVPEFGTKFVRGMLEDTKPTTFEELIRISRIISWYRCMA